MTDTARHTHHRTVPRRARAEWTPAADRADPLQILREQERGRVAELVPIRHERMLQSPFAFFRGAAAIMAADLATTPTTGLRAQICGDAHLANFGMFAAPDRSLVFDVNDFDETAPGPWEWDVKRLAASVEIHGRELGLRSDERHRAVRAAARSYREGMRRFAAMRTLEMWYSRLNVADLPGLADADVRRDLRRAVQKARRKNSLRALTRLTHVVDGAPRIVSDPPLVVPLAELVADSEEVARGRVLDYLQSYRESLAPDRRHLLSGYVPADVALKVVGVGSVGTRCWIVLLLGRDASDPLFLQVKEAGRSVVAATPGLEGGQRVVHGQRLMQSAGDILLGWFAGDMDDDGQCRSYYVRQLWDEKGTMPIEAMDADVLRDYARACGWALAHAHARTGPRSAIADYLGPGTRFDRAIATFAEAYAEQNASDFAAFAAAVQAGEFSLPEVG